MIGLEVSSMRLKLPGVPSQAGCPQVQHAHYLRCDRELHERTPNPSWCFGIWLIPTIIYIYTDLNIEVD